MNGGEADIGIIVAQHFLQKRYAFGDVEASNCGGDKLPNRGVGTVTQLA